MYTLTRRVVYVRKRQAVYTRQAVYMRQALYYFRMSGVGRVLQLPSASLWP